jgi:undecaprenyl-diphosphatase
MNKRLLSVSTLSFLLFLAIWASVASGATNEMDERLLQLFDAWDWLNRFTVLGNNYTIGTFAGMSRQAGEFHSAVRTYIFV